MAPRNGLRNARQNSKNSLCHNQMGILDGAKEFPLGFEARDVSQKISKRHATNTTNKTNAGKHGTSVAKHHADLCEKIQLAIRSRKKFAFVRGNSPSWSRPQPAPSKTRGIKSSPPLHKKKTVKNDEKSMCLFERLRWIRSHGKNVAATRVQLRIEVDSNYHI